MTAITAGGAHRKSRAVDEAAGRDEPIGALLRIRHIGYAVLGLQLVGFMVWSEILYSRFAMSSDFGQYYQAWFNIAHGHLDPYDTLGGFTFWRNNSEFILWPLSLLYWLCPQGITLVWLQDICVVATEVIAFKWMAEIAARHQSSRASRFLLVAGLLLLVLNPWTWWSISFDLHMETLATLFLALVIRDVAKGRRRAWAWVLALLICGDVACTYLAGAGLGCALADRRTRASGLVMAGIGICAVIGITCIHGNIGAGRGLEAYGYLAFSGAAGSSAQIGVAGLVKGIITHPANVIRALWSKRADIWANLAPAGIVGVAFAWLLPVFVIVLLENSLLQGNLFARPSFQSVPLYVLLPIGTIAGASWLARRHLRAGLVLAAVSVAQATCWAAVWIPGSADDWLRVGNSAAMTLSEASSRIPEDAQVVASQGIVGRFGQHRYVYGLVGPWAVPVVQRDVWFVVAPTEGIETLGTASAMALISELSGPLHAQLVVHANGVWAFRWVAPPGVRSITVPGQPASLDAWTSPGAAGRDVLAGPPRTWHVTSTGGRGYVADGLQWQESPGAFVASAAISASGPVNVEVWNDNCNALLARRTVPATTGVASITIPVRVAVACEAPEFSGWGPFRADLIAPPAGQRLEIRVWSPGHENVSVYGASLVRVTRNG
jgi:hypothetical protein